MSRQWLSGVKWMRRIGVVFAYQRGSECIESLRRVWGSTRLEVLVRRTVVASWVGDR
jgi:hypothetical protein